MKLIYFPLNARALAHRLLLDHGNVQYEDEVVSFADFGARKAAGEFPNGQVPVWVQDGTYYNESLAILRFLGAQYGYYPEDIFTAHDADAVVDYANDFIGKLYKPHMQKDFSDDNKKDYCDNITKFCAFFEKKLEKSGSHFITGSKLTTGDFMIGAVLFNFVYNNALAGGAAFTDEGQAIVKKHPKFCEYVERLKTECKHFLDTRAQYPF